MDSVPLLSVITLLPFDVNNIVIFFILLILLSISAFVSSSEVAFFSLSPNDFNKMNDDSDKDKLIKTLLSEPDYLLSTILISNNLVNVSIIVLSSFFINKLFTFANPIIGFIFESVIITFIILLLSEIMPKIYAQQHSLSLCRFAAGPLKNFKTILKPFNIMLVKSTSIVNKRISKHKSSNNLSIDVLSQALELTSDNIEEDKDILQGIVTFGNLTAASVMTPRMDIVSLNITSTFTQVIECIVENEYSRIPVLEGSTDNIRGVLYAKDLIPHLNKGANFKWQTLIRPPYFVPETKKIDNLLQEFQKNKIHIAIVVDEFGGTSGLVTMEDVLEEVVGDISDEYDQENKLYSKLNANTYIFDGKILLTDFIKTINAPAEILMNKYDEVDTLAGLILEIKSDFPKLHEQIIFNNWTFEIMEINSRRISKIKFTNNEPHEK